MSSVQHYDSEPRWPAVIAILAVGGLYTALPDSLTFGPDWLFPSLVLALLIPTSVSYHTGRHRLNAILGFAVDGVLTVELIVSVILLVDALPAGKEAPQQLLLSAAFRQDGGGHGSPWADGRNTGSGRAHDRASTQHDGPALVEVIVSRQELSMPPTITLEQMKGFSLFMLKAVLSGRGDEIIDLATTNLFR